MVLLKDRTFDMWAPEGRHADIRALTWTSQGRLACLTGEGAVLVVDPTSGAVVPVIRAGGETP